MTEKFLLLCCSLHGARQVEARLFSDPQRSEVADLLQEGLASLLGADVLSDGL